eukprot:CAMPEP_0176412710 /NCGR_PEP_ID=MMETSP0127-20121128/4294_1 /TAXON_ID=938130 /ORGANISM="Platyophrya macrostoma, Strain WH" /LENGTH=266 /DNA_ID=CAMNT_0017792409 /DNA_START=66 /DNA_END=863 /DNA_ORIENTATION=+
MEPQLCKLLENGGLGHTVQGFDDGGIRTVAQLTQLTMQDYQSVGVSVMTDRRKLFELIQLVKREPPGGGGGASTSTAAPSAPGGPAGTNRSFPSTTPVRSAPPPASVYLAPPPEPQPPLPVPAMSAPGAASASSQQQTVPYTSSYAEELRLFGDARPLDTTQGTGFGLRRDPTALDQDMERGDGMLSGTGRGWQLPQQAPQPQNKVSPPPSRVVTNARTAASPPPARRNVSAVESASKRLAAAGLGLGGPSPSSVTPHAAPTPSSH